MSTPPRRRLRIGFWPIAYAAVGVILLVPLVSQIMAGTPPTPTFAAFAAAPLPSGLEAAITSVFDPNTCTTPAIAARDLRKSLDAAGFGAWTIFSMATAPVQCVSWSLRQQETTSRTVTLVPTLSPEVRASITEFREKTFADCLTKAHATDTFTAKLTSLGLADFVIRTDGPFQVPLDREKEVIAHFEAGCWMYSTYGWIDERFTFFLSGKEVLGGQSR